MPATATGRITRIGIVTIYVRDQDAALEFYTKVLGFDKLMDERSGEGFRRLTVKPRGAETQIVLAAKFAADSGTPLGGSTGMVLYTDDIHALHQEFASKGIQFTEAPTQQPWGMIQAQFRDLDGNNFVLVQQ
jgi:lactoylglutathione lyase